MPDIKSARYLLRALSANKCPAHCNGGHMKLLKSLGTSHLNNPKEYAFEFTASTLRFGAGVTKEVGQDISLLNAKKTLVVTDKNLVNLQPYHSVVSSLTHNKCNFETFDLVQVEPSDKSFNQAIEFARRGAYDAFVAVGGGSVMDTAKVCALFSTNRKAELLDYVGPPFGKSLVPQKVMAPLICVPTTAGTGSETTAVAIFDLESEKSKFGIRTRKIKPTLGLVDPENMRSVPRHVAIYAGFDVLCHALESYTVLPYDERIGCESPDKRPVYQGRNPLSDVWCREALRILEKYFVRSVENPEDMEARSSMLQASSFAGMGFGNAGVHLCHGLSYSISSSVRNYISPDYPDAKPVIPHGLSVVMTAPADFEFIGHTSPERHLEAAKLLGQNIENVKTDDAGAVLGDVIRKYMRVLKVPNGLESVGFTRSDIAMLTRGALPTMKGGHIYPKRADAEEIVSSIYEKSLTVY